MEQRDARMVAVVGALVVVGFMLIVVFGSPVNAPTASGIAIIYAIAAAAILRVPRRWAAWVATAITVPTGLLTAAVFALSSSNQAAVADVLNLLLVTLMLGGAALAMHAEASRKASSPAE